MPSLLMDSLLNDFKLWKKRVIGFDDRVDLMVCEALFLVVSVDSNSNLDESCWCEELQFEVSPIKLVDDKSLFRTRADSSSSSLSSEAAENSGNVS